MTKRTRRNHTQAFKAKVALAAIEGREDAGRVGAAVRRPPIKSRKGRVRLTNEAWISNFAARFGIRRIDPAAAKTLKWLERVKGIEPSYSAWKAAALPLSYTRVFNNLSRDFAHSRHENQ